MDESEILDDPMEIEHSLPETVIIERSNKKQNNIDCENGRDVVVLDDDDDDEDSGKIVKSNSKSNGIIEEFINLVPETNISECINYLCKNGIELINAPIFCLSYYRVKSSSKIEKKVCFECYKQAIQMYDKLVTQLKTGNSLFSVNVPLLNDMVEIDDSDEEDDDQKVSHDYLDEKNFQFIKEHYDEILDETMNKFNFEGQISMEMAAVKERFLRSQEKCRKLNDDLKNLRQQADKLQINFYNEFKPEISDVGTRAEIIDDFIISSNLQYREYASLSKSILTLPKTPLPTASKKQVKQPCTTKIPMATRKSFRKANPVTYVEVEDEVNANGPKSPALPESPVTDKISEDLKSISPIKKVEKPNNLPPDGNPIKPALDISEIYYITRDGNPTGCWVRARLIDVTLPGSTYDGKKVSNTLYKLVELKQQKERIVEGKYIAYKNAASTLLRVGNRVIAVFNEGFSNEPKCSRKSNAYYPGIVAEPPYEANNYRYLIFFDIGYSQYVSHNLVNLVFRVSNSVWEDMPPDCRPFIKKHIESQDWPMVKLKKNQSIITEYNGKWFMCKVIEVDCSLVQVYFDELHRFEWIYRGSRRIKEIFKQELAASNRSSGQRASRKGQIDSKNIVQYTPNVNYTPATNNILEQQYSEQVNNFTESHVNVRAVARKSTAKPQNQQQLPLVSFLPSTSNIFNISGPTSKIMYFTPRDQHTMKRSYRPHLCSSKCKEFLTHSVTKLRGQNPLSKPLLCGWARMTVKVRGRKEISYRAPCGRMLRNMGEVHYYLTVTQSEMTIDLFDFNHMVRCLAEFSVDCVPDPRDLSKGLEQVPIPVINGINNELLEFCHYSTKRVPMEGVKMNLDPDFLVCCDCDDDCIDKTKCACWKLTLEGANFFDNSVDPNSVGYIYRRLQEQVVTGIYECNSKCKCKSTCLNRVAQNPMSLKLQVFRTHNRGWGIRCLNDVPQGTFICVYAGTINTDQRANEDGQTFGDEYFAELDYIESVEQYKDEFEKEVDLLESDRINEKDPQSPFEGEMEVETIQRNSSAKRRYQDDNEFVPSIPITKTQSELKVQTRLRRRKPQEQNEIKNKENEYGKIEKPFSFGSSISSIDIKKEEIDINIVERLSNLNTKIDTVTISDDEDEEREVLSFNPKNESDLEKKSEYLTVREQYGIDERIYIMDAKVTGNIGRFLNHSCAPNVFVQNVFVDTHDPRFPWVAFFSSQFIRAGTELTWNYSYDVGSVPGKVLYCHCAALECKGRLL